jgi:hypothetical protein
MLKLWSRRKPALAGAATLIFCLIVICGIIGAVASRQRLNARIASLELEKKQIQDDMRISLISGLTKLRDTYRLNTELLNQIWVLEYFFGPTLLNRADATADVWNKRIHTIRWLVKDARDHGRGDDMETLLWESALAFWLVCDGDYAESEPLLAANRERWSQRLAPVDEWLSQLQVLSACAVVNRQMAQTTAKDAATLDPAELDAAIAALNQADVQLTTDRAGTPIHMLVLDSLKRAYEPALRNDVQIHDALAIRYKALYDNKQKKPAKPSP